ncbi:MAG: deoxyribodipyrimidine photo-lyase [Proteobacteria bacterium]|nr:deoxyribodipyrimidine photo-lyase [Pseudomonadota bacterium]
MQVVWLKRDLRLHDHAPLHTAVESGESVVLLYVLEPEYVVRPDTSTLHLWWITSSLRYLNQTLASYGAAVTYLKLPIQEALSRLLAVGRFTLHSHQETGNLWSFDRDRKVAAWCKDHGILWREHKQFGVFRGLKDRSGWSKRRDAFFAKPLLPVPDCSRVTSIDCDEITVIRRDAEGVLNTLVPGEEAGIALLNSFLLERHRRYLPHIADPVGSVEFSSRLSPYLAFGNLSLRRVFAATQRRIEGVGTKSAGPCNRRALNAFRSRLYWHCHFIQKLESQPSIEQEDFNPAFVGMRDPHHNDEHLRRWQEGNTGYPFLDACMRSLRQTGWISFRMRAMLVSFASYDLLLDWRRFAHFLARLFIDYEPGIHYSQLQMQSGTTGINATRMYDPIKQGYTFDPTGAFVKGWVPELQAVPELFIHEPWKMSVSQQEQCRCIIGTDYPTPIVEHRVAIKKARALLAQYRASPEFKEANKAVFSKHGSRKRGERKVRSKGTRQLSLFDPA